MFGQNPKRGIVKGDGSVLAVQEVFPTLQGEGPYTGWPAVFVRLGGCNLACAFCDTEFESFTDRNTAELVEEVVRMAEHNPSPASGRGRRSEAEAGEGLVGDPIGPHPDPLPQAGEGTQTLSAHGVSKRIRNLAVITGGEPLRQPIAPFCEALLARGFKVQIETNGTLWRADIPEAVDVVCSPKAPGGKYGPLREDVLARAQALKFIISADHPGYTEVPEVGQAKFNVPVYVQPMDEYDPAKNAANMRHALALAQNQGYRLSVQMHKIAGIP